MSNIAQRIEAIKSKLPEGVDLLAVSKYYPKESAAEAYAAGHRRFGESRVQELCPKQEALPKDIEWHFIGTLQTNKVKYIAEFIHTIHSVDSLKLLQEIEKQAARHNRVIRVLLELHIAAEETKHGLKPDEALAMAEAIDREMFPHIEFAGIMTMATFTDDKAQVRNEFKTAADTFARLRSILNDDKDSFRELSMGMSDDYTIAIDEGSTMIRVGSAIFAE